MKGVLITGANGQLGQCLQKIAPLYKDLKFTFKNSKDLDITDSLSIKKIFASGDFHFCINCAAYTNVEQAEKTPDIAYRVNAEGVKNLAKVCKSYNTTLIHISTDYVFDGEKDAPYTVKDVPNPINEYGKSKLLGEKHIQEIMDNYCIIRTSWLYSEFGKNFYKTILKKAKAEENLSVTDEQLGCPTNANNLALHIVEKLIQNNNFGIEHFTDGYSCTWFGFAKKILIEHKLQNVVQLRRDKNYRTFARRPVNSVLK
ncbi:MULTISPECIES: dTDP-4-dehydrorhamnose reductase [unclassified Maribacter]|uniref:dTDP-4-dehydrorhamnose reductase n=1 Tax=unclassified Maribacter TaxID=2615042 RepID=UPI00257F5E20|nr:MULTISPECIES: dTDP-4-dehydrorhamnose reductase [unclassified Maribacter]|tara:strand:- start:632 stop:1402 length:771 start_codon:yes stop_codon:yes gene_type:complete